jgi:hypothetical protein
MAIRFYLIPIDEVARDSGGTYRLPKYVTTPRDPRGDQLLGVTVDRQFMDFGLEPTALIALNVTAGQHTTLVAQSDVVAVPVNLDATLGANLATVQAALESLHIPADSLVAGATYRQVVRAVVGIFLLAQRFSATANTRLFPASVVLTTTLGDLSANVRGQLQSAAEALGYSYAGLTLSSTLRDMLKAIGNQQSPLAMLGVAI